MSQCPATVYNEVLCVGTRPPTEPLAEVRASGLLQKVDRENSTIFADGNTAWRSEANRLPLRHVSVNHQKKEFVRKDRKKKGQKGSTMAGTQMLDRCWQSLKKFVGPHWPRKIGKGCSSKVRPDLSLLVSQFQWRRSIGVVSGATFLHELSRVFAQRGRNSRWRKKNTLIGKQSVWSRRCYRWWCWLWWW